MLAADLINLIRPARPKRLWACSPLYHRFLANPDWVVEPKYNGWRCLVAHGSDGVQAWSRQGKRLDFAPDAEIRPGCVFDGEYLRATGELVLFDVPVIDGAGNGAPLELRRHHLVNEFPRFGPVRVITRLKPTPDVLLRAKERGFEGLVLKNQNSTYPDGNTLDWVKVKG